MKVYETRIPGVHLIEPRVFSDPRGFFMETWQAERYQQAHIPGPFVQDNYSYSARGVLRGLHYQLKYPQGKLVYVLQGEVFDVAVDIRRGSPTFGRWVGEILSGDNHKQLYIPQALPTVFVCSQRWLTSSINARTSMHQTMNMGCGGMILP